MTKYGFAILGTAILGVSVAGSTMRAAPATPRADTPKTKPAMAASHTPELMTPDAQNKLVGYYCTACHDDEAKTGGLTLEHFDATRLDQNVETAEKMIHKLRLGMMPPPSVKDRPDPATVKAFVTALERLLALGRQWNAARAAGRPASARQYFERAPPYQREFARLGNALGVYECAPIEARWPTA